MKTNALSNIKVIPVTSTIKHHLDLVPNNGLKMKKEDVIQGMLTIFINEEELKLIKVAKNRERYDSVSQYLAEIPSEVIMRVYDLLLDGAVGQKWRKLPNGFSYYTLLQWLAKQYPVIQVMISNMDKLRERARAERVLDKLESFVDSEDENINCGARVKACELLLRATHKAFGAPTESKTESNRPIINVNLAQIFGNDTKTEQTSIDVV